MAADPDLLLWNPLRGVVDLPSAALRHRRGNIQI
jgi:hypothetical protein